MLSSPALVSGRPRNRSPKDTRKCTAPPSAHEAGTLRDPRPGEFDRSLSRLLSGRRAAEQKARRIVAGVGGQGGEVVRRPPQVRDDSLDVLLPSRNQRPQF